MREKIVEKIKELGWVGTKSTLKGVVAMIGAFLGEIYGIISVSILGGILIMIFQEQGYRGLMRTIERTHFFGHGGLLILGIAALIGAGNGAVKGYTGLKE